MSWHPSDPKVPPSAGTFLYRSGVTYPARFPTGRAELVRARRRPTTVSRRWFLRGLRLSIHHHEVSGVGAVIGGYVGNASVGLRSRIDPPPELPPPSLRRPSPSFQPTSLS